MKRIFIILLMLICKFGFATHMIGAYITMQHQSGYTYQVNYISLTNVGPQIQADRCTMTIYFSDGDSIIANRINGPMGSCMAPSTIGEVIANGVKYNHYQGLKTFNNPGIYTAWAQDANRTDGIINIPGSVNIPMYNQSLITVVDPALYCPISTVELGAFPITKNGINYKYLSDISLTKTHSDSVSYSIDTCRNTQGNSIVGYTYPLGTNLNTHTGKIAIDSFSFVGNYALAIRINTWRNGILISYVTVDFLTSINANNTLALNLPINTNLVQNNDSVYIGNFSINDTIAISYNNSQQYQIKLYSEINDSLITSNTNGTTTTLKMVSLALLERKQAYKLTLRAINNPMTLNESKDYIFYFNIGNNNPSTCTLPQDLGTAENKLTSIQLFPNPANDFVSIQGAKNQYLKIYDIYGKTIYNKQLKSETEKIDIQNLSNGIYIINIGNYSSKFVKN